MTFNAFGQDKPTNEKIDLPPRITEKETNEVSGQNEKKEERKEVVEENSEESALEIKKSQSNARKLRRFEIGLHYSNLNFGVFDVMGTKVFERILRLDTIGFPIFNEDWNEVESGIGARITFNFTKNIAAESEANWYLRSLPNRGHRLSAQPLGVPLPPSVGPYQGGQKFQMLFGPKIGYRNRKFGVFGKVRPGFVHFIYYPTLRFLILGEPGFALAGIRIKRQTFFNIDLGGVFEYYPSTRTVIRFDIGDTIIRYNKQVSTPDVSPSFSIPGFTRHNLQINVGVGIRF